MYKYSPFIQAAHLLFELQIFIHIIIVTNTMYKTQAGTDSSLLKQKYTIQIL